MASYIMIAALLVASAFREGRASPTTTEPRPCIQLEIPVGIDTTATKWLQLRVDSNIDAVDWVADLTTRTSPNLTERMIGEVRIKDTFKIPDQLCVPPRGTKWDILQIATHGIGFDKRYWDAETKPDEYSYVRAALGKGYSVFTYERADRDPPPADGARPVRRPRPHGHTATAATTTRSNSNSNTDTDDLGRFKIVHVGHSLGSTVPLGLISSGGSGGGTDNGKGGKGVAAESDGVVATGFLPGGFAGMNVATFGPEFARERDGTRSRNYLNKKGSFGPALLEYAWAVLQPASVSEFVSVGTTFSRGVPGFRGPLQNTTARYAAMFDFLDRVGL
ncbi:hypothetical protein VTG60DRAFT_2963 [Thermothelomyces hinnuleus]